MELPIMYYGMAWSGLVWRPRHNLSEGCVAQSVCVCVYGTAITHSMEYSIVLREVAVQILLINF